MTTQLPGAEHQIFNIGVKAIIIRDKRILMVRRADHDVWEVPGGRIGVGEDATKALMREITEELPGTQTTHIGDILYAEQTDFFLPNGNRLMLLFFPVTVRPSRNQIVSEEHTDISWVSFSDIPSMHIQPAARHAVECALTAQNE